METYFIGVFGPAGVGKSAFTLQMVQGEFYGDYDPTIDETYRKNVIFDGSNMMLEILQSTGLDEQRLWDKTKIKFCQGFILMYSINSRSSLDLAMAVKKEIEEEAESPDLPFVLVGNKADLTDTERMVEFATGHDLASNWGIPFFEGSAKDRINVVETFQTIVREIQKKRLLTSTSKASSSRSKCTIM